MGGKLSWPSQWSHVFVESSTYPQLNNSKMLKYWNNVLRHSWILCKRSHSNTWRTVSTRAWTLHTMYELAWEKEGCYLGYWSVHSIRKGEVLFISSVYIQKGYWMIKSKGRCKKAAIRFSGKIDNQCASFIQFTCSSISSFHPLLSYRNSPQWLPCLFLLDFAFGL